MGSKNYIFGRKYAGNLLLDKHPADLAYSVFKLSTFYSGYCLRVVRSSDFATLDVGYVNGVLDFSTILSFIGSNSGYVNRLYNPANGNTATQDVIGSMPRIVNSGVLETLNGNPALYFDGVDDFFHISIETVTNDFSLFAYGKRTASGDLFAPLSGGGSAFLHYTDNNYYFQMPAGYSASNSTDSTTAAYLVEGHTDGSTRSIYKNQSLVPSTFNSVPLVDFFSSIGTYSPTGIYMKGHVTEILLYKTNKITDRVAISDDILIRNS